jgi:hypothetical protein
MKLTGSAAETPNPKSQTPMKHENPILKHDIPGLWCLGLLSCLLLGVWDFIDHWLNTPARPF